MSIFQINQAKFTKKLAIFNWAYPIRIQYILLYGMRLAKLYPNNLPSMRSANAKMYLASILTKMRQNTVKIKRILRATCKIPGEHRRRGPVFAHRSMNT